MSNTCVCCGRDIPEGTQFCHSCDILASKNCPTCSSVLELMNKSKYITEEGFGYSTIFHCNSCHEDWELEEEYAAQPIKYSPLPPVFKRKFWG